MVDIGALIERVEKLTGPDRWVDEQIVEALGGQVRLVSRLGLNGRSRGSDRVFWPATKSLRGAPIPTYTRDEQARSKTIALLRAKQAQEPAIPQARDEET